VLQSALVRRLYRHLQMNAIKVLAALALTALASEAGAQTLNLTITSGRISLDAREVSVSQILAEWARVGDVRIVNGEQTVALPITLQLSDVPEAAAVGILLRQVSGYVVVRRTSAGPSTIASIVILPSSTRLCPNRNPESLPSPASTEPVVDQPSDRPSRPENPPYIPACFAGARATTNESIRYNDFIEHFGRRGDSPSRPPFPGTPPMRAINDPDPDAPPPASAPPPPPATPQPASAPK
jgi:hypothetical protein